MKISLLLLFACTLQILAMPMGAQNAVVKLSSNKIELGKLIREIENQTDYLFVYRNREIDTKRVVNVQNRSAKVSSYLDEAFDNTDILYEFENNYIVLTSKELKENAVNQQSNKIISGRVVDAHGEALIGASVVIKGTQTGTVTDVDGNFSINCEPGTKLIFSYIGHITIELIAAAGMEVVLNENLKELEEVVVIGYGTTKRKDFTGSVSSIKLENSPVSLIPSMNAMDALKGNVAGLNIGATTGTMSEPSIQVRGQNSIKGENTPLIVLDGVIYMGNLSDINSNDIASFDILKDAVSAAAYGSKAANGIIAITTKKGRSQKPVITLNASLAFQNWTDRPVPLKGADWINLVNAANSYAPGTTSWLKPQEVANMDAGQERNWVDDIAQTGMIQNYQIAVSGAKDKVNYYLSASYDDNKGVVYGDAYNRLTVLGKINTEITSWLSIGMDANFSRREYSGIWDNGAKEYTAGVASVYRAVIMTPYGAKYRDDQGNLEKYPAEQGGSFINPLWTINDGLMDNEDVRQNFLLNSYALITVPKIKGLTYRFNLQNLMSLRESGQFTHEGNYIGEGPVTNTQRYAESTVRNYLAQANGWVTEEKTVTYLFDNILNYKNTFNKHGIDLTFVATRDCADYDSKKMSGTDFASNGNTSLGINGLPKSTTQKLDFGGNKKTNIGYLGRINYTYDDKYFLTASYRRDGASIFGTDTKWGNFAAAGIGWRISNENFLKDLKPLNDLKLKFSWGQNGNQSIAPYGTMAQVDNGSTGGIRYEFSDASSIYYGLKQKNMGNSLLGWEATEKLNLGFESTWLDQRLYVDIDIYKSKTTDELYDQTIPSMTGFSTIKASLGEVQNKGIEVTVRTTNIRNRDWSWTTGFTYWANRNKLVRLDGLDLNHDGIEDDKIADGMFIGKPLNSIYGYVWDGIIQAGDDAYKAMPGASTINGYPKYKDVDGDGKITADDRKILGYPQENFRLNMSNSVNYKNVELYVMISGIFGGGGYYMKDNPLAYQSTTSDGFNTNMTYRPYYTAENPSNTYPAPYFKGDGKFKGLQSRTFVRVQNITLSYNFNQSWIKEQAKINNLRVFFTANNPFLFTGWDGGDPEAGIVVLSKTPPMTSSYSLGAKIEF